MNNVKKTIAIACMVLPAIAAVAQVHGINKADMDLSVAPGQDFFEYAGGGWMKANPLKPEYSSYGVFNDLAENNRKQLRSLIEDLQKTQQQPGSNGQKVIDLYDMAMDSVRLNKEGAAPLQHDLAIVKALKRSDLTREIARQHLCMGNPFFGIGVQGDLMNSNMNVLYMDAGGMSMPDRDYYLNTDAKSKKIQQLFRDYIVKLFTLAGYSKADAQAASKTVYNMEYQFAKAMMSRAEARDYTKQYNIYTVEQLQKEYPAVNWTEYFTLMGIPATKQVILAQPKVMAVAQNFMKTLTDKQLRYYLAYNIISGASGELSDAFRDANFDFYGRTLSGQKEQKPRWKRALGYPNGMLGEVLGQLYVAKYFPSESKTKMLKLIENLRKSLATHIANLTWMSDSTKINALVKLNSYMVKVGYPDKWRDYSKLSIDPKLSLYENVKNVTAFNTRYNLDKMDKPVDKTEWGMTPQTVNAYYNPLNNEIVFPAAILQPPFFDPKADDATNYGAIGVVIGHEMTHGFDDQGRMFDANGNMKGWWTEQDSKRFNALAEKLAAQFDKIVVVNGEHANGHLTLGENIADQGGLRVSYDAFKNTQEYQQGKPVDGFTPTQRFYLSYGRIWAENMTDEAMYQQTKSDPHSIGRNRVNATLRNIDTFYNAFNIKSGDKMWLDPADRVVIW